MEINGFLNINKRSGFTSAAVVGRVKRLTGVKRTGHMGTLDPMASGVLPVAVGRGATKLFDALLAKKKRYTASFRFGLLTDTLDTAGTVTAEGGRVPDEAEIRAALPELTGRIEQLPPAYSAKSVNGVRAYKLARRGEEVELSPKSVEVFGFELIGTDGGDFVFDIACGSGTYIRSLARDLGDALGTYCVMSALVRTESGVFKLDDAVRVDDLNPENFTEYLIDVETVRRSLLEDGI